MEQEQKEKLLKYLCMALPYGVKVKVTKVPIQLSKDEVLTYNRMYSLSEPEEYITVKPYLRPMSSMREEEKKEYQYVTERWMYDANHSIADSIDWLLENHFDFMGLIPIGRAIDCTDLDIY